MADAVLQLEAVHKSYGVGVVTEVLKGIDLRIDRGEFAALVGPSGSGKSTLLNLLGLLDRPTSGRVTIVGEETTALDDAGVTRLRGRAIGFVFQFHHLLPGLSACENVMMPMIAAAGRTAKDMVPRARALLDRVGLAAKADALPSAMSGGQQQRVAIARALAMAPQVMFFDEATSALDPELVKGILSLIAELGADGMTMVVVTHEMGFAQSTADSVVFMDHGTVIESGPPEQIFSAAQTDRLQRFLSQVL